MSIHVPANFFKETITRAVTLTGATNIYVSAHPSPAEGYVTISPASATLREIVYYTSKATDGNGTYLTVTLANRGLGGTTAQTHAIGEPVRMNVTAETIQEISDAIDQIVAAGAQDATVSIKGISRGASETELGIVEEATDAEVTAGTATGGTGAKLFVTPAKLATRMSSILKFGGTGADGALSITSGATNIDLGSAAVVTKNYTSISITGTGSLTFTNPHANGTVVVLKSQGNVTLTSSTAPMIAAQGTGAIGATGGSDFDSVAQGFDGSAGNAGNNFTGWNTGGGGGGIDQSSGGTAGAGGTAISTKIFDLTSIYSGKYPNLVIGGGGGAGGAQMSTGSGQVTSGNGGRGGGCLIIECAGALNFTTASGISVNGAAGTNASFVSGGNATGGGGGGGGGGSCIIFYNALTANSGTIIVAGGAGGNGVINGAGVLLGSGGGGGSVTAGSAGVSSTNPAGGAGGNGYSLVAANTEFA